METFDRDDRQAQELQVLAESVVFGQPKYRAVQGGLMENLSYDASMPVDRPIEPAWRSIVEPGLTVDAFTAAEIYDRRNGLGRYWGRAEPSLGAPQCETLDVFREAFEKAGLPREAACVGTALVLLIALGRKAG